LYLLAFAAQTHGYAGFGYRASAAAPGGQRPKQRGIRRRPPAGRVGAYSHPASRKH